MKKRQKKKKKIEDFNSILRLTDGTIRKEVNDI